MERTFKAAVKDGPSFMDTGSMTAMLIPSIKESGIDTSRKPGTSTAKFWRKFHPIHMVNSELRPQQNHTGPRRSQPRRL